MNKKKMTYILAPLVIIIWAGVFYRMFNYFGDDDIITTKIVTAGRSEKIQVKRDTFSLAAKYRDPFLGNAGEFYPGDGNSPEQDEAADNKKQATPLVRETKPVIPVKWPAIEYGGLITNPKTQKILGLVKVNNREYLVNEGDIYDKAGFKELYADSVIVNYGGEEKTIIKK